MDLEKKEEKERKNRSNLRALLFNALIIIGVVALGLVVVNQYLALRYKAELLSIPCDLCLELNPRLDPCFNSALTIYKDPEGNEISKEEYLEGRYTIDDYSDVNISSMFIQP